MINSQTGILGIIGCPLKHTLSPLIHNTAINHHKLNLAYLPFEVAPSRLSQLFKGLISTNVLGINVTIPYKEKVIRYLDELTPEAKMIGAVNTIKFEREGEGKVKSIGFNTDMGGFVKSLREEGQIDLKGKNVLILGAGGAAKGVAVGLVMNQANNIIITNRTPDRAEKLKSILRRLGKEKNVGAIEVVPFKKKILSGYVPTMDIIINTTSIGMKGESIEEFPIGDLRPGQIVYDLIYSPPETKLLKEAKKKGAKAINGLGMLLEQGSLAFEIWTGKKFPIDLIRESVFPR